MHVETATHCTSNQALCRQTRWSTCLLTGQPLSKGKVVADLLGNLYLFDAVVEFLLARTGVFLDDESEVQMLSPASAHPGACYWGHMNPHSWLESSACAAAQEQAVL